MPTSLGIIDSNESAIASAIQAELDRLGASTDGDTIGLDCDGVTDGVATFSDSQEVARYDASAALAALRQETADDHESGFAAAWHALTRLPEVEGDGA